MPDLPDPGAFVAALAPALRQAAAIAHSLEGLVSNNPKRGETTAVKQALTVADTASQEALLVALLEHFPGVRLEAEEDTPSVSRFPSVADAVVVIDPIDGTFHSYLGSQGPYAVLVGLAVAGRFEASLVALGREGLFFDGVRGQGARGWRTRTEPRRARLSDRGRRVLVSHGMPERVSHDLRAAGFEPMGACGGAVAVAPLIPGVCGGVRYASGDGGVSIRGRVGVLVSREAGAFVSGARGPFPDDLETPAPTLAVSRNEEDLATLCQVLSDNEL